jgi:hypothetical protein
MVLPLGAEFAGNRPEARPDWAKSESRVPPHSGFRCHLSEQPDHLVPEHLLQSCVSAQNGDGHLLLNPDCRFMRAADFVADLGDRAWLIDGFSFPPDEVVALVRDAGTSALHPFWLDAELGSVLTELAEDAIPFLSPYQLCALTLAGILVTPDHSLKQRTQWNETIVQCAAQFARQEYAPIAGLIHPLHLSAMRRYYRQLVRTGKLPFGDSQNSRRYGAHNESVARFFHHELTAVISAIAGEPIKPSYVYFSAYQEGAELTEHLDRNQCEISITLCLDYTPECLGPTQWPIRLRTAGGQTTVFQAIGDALLYRGCRLPHSRGRLPEGHTSTSLFLHYVQEDFDGPLY